MKITWQNTICAWFSLLIIYTCINTLGDSLALISGALENRTTSYTPLWIKAGKDLLLVSAALLATIRLSAVRVSMSLVILTSIWFAFTFAFSCFWSVDNPTSSLMGIRYATPAIYLLFGATFYNIRLDKAKTALALALLIHVCLQIIQAIYAPNFFGHRILGINLRNTGMFITPTFAGAFPILCYLWPNAGKSMRLLSIFSLLLSNSTTSLLAFCSYAYIRGFQILQISTYLKISIALMFATLFAPIVMMSLPTLTGRGDAVWVSSGTRGELAVKSSEYIVTLGKGFGLGTSMAVLRKERGAEIADNTIVSSLISGGGLYAAVTVAVIAYCAYFLLMRNLLLSALFFGMSMTVIIFEATPFVQIFFFFAGQEAGKSIRWEEKTENDCRVNPSSA